MDTYVMKFGLLPPLTNGDVVIDQLFKSVVYRNKFVEIEIKARDFSRAIDASVGDIAGLEEKIRLLTEQKEAADKEIKRERARTRSRSDTLEMRIKSKELGKELKPLKEELRAARKLLKEDPHIIAQKELMFGKKKEDGEDKRGTNDGLKAEWERQARAVNGLHWGTYQMVETAANQSFAMTPMYDGIEPNNPGFCRWSGEGHVAAHIQNRILLGKDLFRNDSQVKIDPVPEKAYLKETPRCERKRMQRSVLHLHIGPKDNHIWMSWPIILHREIPKDAKITWVAVSRRKVGPNVKWTCEITMQCERKYIAPPTRSGVVAIQFGWYKDEDGIRSAKWMDTNGHSDEMILGCFGNDKFEPKHYGSRSIENHDGRGGIVTGITKAKDIKSIRSKNFDIILPKVVDWLRDNDMPEWMMRMTVQRDAETPSKAQALCYMGQWKAQRKLVMLFNTWMQHRIYGDSLILQEIEAWRYNDQHLWEWECEQMKSAVLRRNEVYKLAAIKLVETYDEILLDTAKFNQLARRPKTESEDPYIQAMQFNRFVAAPGKFREILIAAAAKRGCKITEQDPQNESITCPLCQEVAKPAPENIKAHKFVCPTCCIDWDIDDNRLLNKLKERGFEKEVEAIIETKQADNRRVA